MFIQVIEGRVEDAAGLRKQMDRWMDELKDGSVGWLGTTAGVTPDGNFIALARFEDKAAAQKNSDRPEQGQWWAETEKYLSDVTFSDYDEVVTWGGGGSDDAGFVQVMRGKYNDVAKARELNQRMEGMDMGRPDVIGGVHGELEDGSYTDAIYFTSEAEARENEKKDPPPDVAALWGEWQGVLSDVRYIDLSEPWLLS